MGETTASVTFLKGSNVRITVRIMALRQSNNIPALELMELNNPRRNVDFIKNPCRTYAYIQFAPVFVRMLVLFGVRDIIEVQIITAIR